MTSLEQLVVTDEQPATAHSGAAVERALEAAVRDPEQLGDLLTALRQGRLWLPLPADGRPVTDGSAVCLPTVRYLGSVFVPAYTSAARLPPARQDSVPGPRGLAVPHAVVAAADLARRLPASLGIALNPGTTQSVAIYPPGVADLAAVCGIIGGRRVRVGPLPEPPGDLLARVRMALGWVPAAREAAAAWLSVDQAGQGLVISVTLEDPASPAARQAALAAVHDAARAAPGDVRFPLDVTFPGEGEPDLIDSWIAAEAAPFYQRAGHRSPAGRPPAA